MKKNILSLFLVQFYLPIALLANMSPVSFNFDWDDNIFFMPTKIILFHKQTGSERAVSTHEYAKIKSQIGKTGVYKDFELRGEDRTNGSFRNFGGGDITSRSENTFLNDIKRSVQIPWAQWKAPIWNDFVFACSSSETVKKVTIITARGHSRDEMMEGLRYLQKEGYIKFLPLRENIFPVSSIELGGKASDPSKKKADIMISLLDQYQIQFNQTINKTKNMFLWEFSDDDQKNFQKAFDLLSPEVKKGRWPNIKITLIYSGLNTSELPPQSIVLNKDGLTSAKR